MSPCFCLTPLAASLGNLKVRRAAGTVTSALTFRLARAFASRAGAFMLMFSSAAGLVGRSTTLADSLETRGVTAVPRSSTNFEVLGLPRQEHRAEPGLPVDLELGVGGGGPGFIAPLGGELLEHDPERPRGRAPSAPAALGSAPAGSAGAAMTVGSTRAIDPSLVRKFSPTPPFFATSSSASKNGLSLMSRSIDGLVGSSRWSVSGLPVCFWIIRTASESRMPWTWMVTFEAPRFSVSCASRNAARTRPSRSSRSESS